MSDEHVLFEQIKGQGGHIGLITLNRPDSLNALTHPMCLAMDEQLRAWAKNKKIKAVVIQGSGDRAFSAGGDLRELYEHGKAGNLSLVRDFFHDEYRMNHCIHTYPKPFIALLDGITMGGGVGVSIHGSHRIVTERFTFAMPETAIGFFPDIGGSYFLSRCPGESGVYLGLTGMRLNAAEAIYVSLADSFISSNHLDDVLQAIVDTKFNCDDREKVNEIINQFAVLPETPKLSVNRDNIEQCFAHDSVEEIIAHLQKEDKQWHRETLEVLSQKSPTSLKVTLREIREGVNMDFEGCMKMEFRLCQRFMQGHDFFEGIRAVIIDKDHAPVWSPGALEEVTATVVDSYFADLPFGELCLASEK